MTRTHVQAHTHTRTHPRARPLWGKESEKVMAKDDQRRPVYDRQWDTFERERKRGILRADEIPASGAGIDWETFKEVSRSKEGSLSKPSSAPRSRPTGDAWYNPQGEKTDRKALNNATSRASIGYKGGKKPVLVLTFDKTERGYQCAPFTDVRIVVDQPRVNWHEARLYAGKRLITGAHGDSAVHALRELCRNRIYMFEGGWRSLEWLYAAIQFRGFGISYTNSKKKQYVSHLDTSHIPGGHWRWIPQAHKSERKHERPAPLGFVEREQAIEGTFVPEAQPIKGSRVYWIAQRSVVWGAVVWSIGCHPRYWKHQDRSRWWYRTHPYPRYSAKGKTLLNVVRVYPRHER